MDKQPNPPTNGKANTNGREPHFSIQGLARRQIRPLLASPPKRQLLPIFPIMVFLMAIALAVVVTMQDSTFQPAPATVRTEAFRWAVNRAMAAAELTQTAQTREEWQRVADWWQEAIDLMAAVQPSNDNYDLAQEKIVEYQRNLDYAQLWLQKPIANASVSDGLWTIGSRRADIIRSQGQPTEEVRYDALCQETLAYGGSTVELSNGIVTNYQDLDKNLKVVEDTTQTPPRVLGNNGLTWTLGTTRDDVFRLQGTPDRISRYDALNRETLFYGDSTIELVDERVTGYHNADSNLRVSVNIVPGDGTAEPFWSIGAERNDVFRVQGTPTQVTLDNSICKEVLYYGDSLVELTNGFVTGYNNTANNLRVRM